MQNKVRVAPKNIQFKDNVQIREIPSRNADGNGTEEQDNAWDPNLPEEVFNRKKPTKQRNIVIAIAICGLILIGVVVGSVLGTVLSQQTSTVAEQSLSYNEICRIGSNQCKSSQGLSCPNGFCVCSSPYSWNSIATSCTLLTYNQACSTLNQCNSALGLFCINGICNCDGYHSWNSTNNNCIAIMNNTLTYGARCANGSSLCNSSLDLICTGNCTCQNSKVWNISSCVCPAGTFLNSSNLCETAYRFNHTCTIGSNQCDSTRNLSCNVNTSLCKCDQTKYWNLNFETCLPRVNYTEICSDDYDCLPTLICPLRPGMCNCPASLPDLVCNCANETYYDWTVSQCVNRSSFNGPCIISTNYTCLQTLICNAGLCDCPIGTSWIPGNSTCA